MTATRRNEWSGLASMAGVWAVFVLLPDLATIWLDPTGEMSLKMKLVYVVTMSASCVLWIACGVALSRFRARSPRAGWLAVAAFAVAMSLWAGGTLLYRVYFDYNPRPVIFAFFLENFLYVTSLLATSTSLTFKVGVIVAPLALLATLTWVTRYAAAPLPKPRIAYGALAAAAVVQLVCILFPTRVSSSSPDLIGAKTAFAGTLLWAKGTALPMLPRPERAVVTAAPAARKPNVLFVVHESVGRKQVAPWNAKASGPAPEIARFLGAHADHSVWFPRATTVAPVTNVAFPSILSGLSPESPSESFRKAPLVWHDAEAAGYRTALFSAEDYKYSFFRGFFLAKDRPHVYKTAGEISDSRTVDSGVDDALTADAAIEHLRGAAGDKSRPFFVVVQFNGSHFPCWNPKNPSEPVAAFDDAARQKRCDIVIEYIDKQVGRLLATLEETGVLEDTLVVHTADHGETFDPMRPKRPINFYEDTMGVPLAVHVPRSLATAEPTLVQALDANRNARVSNLDIFPTLLDVWGRYPLRQDTAPSDRPALSGQSLLRPMPPERVLTSTARGAIYEPAVQGFAFYHGNLKWLFDEKRGLQLFDLDRDPEERDNTAERAPEAERAFFKRELASHPHLVEPLRPHAPAWLGL